MDDNQVPPPSEGCLAWVAPELTKLATESAEVGVAAEEDGTFTSS